MGWKKDSPEVFAVKLDQEHLKGSPDLHIKLPKDIYTDRMGSAYLVNDTTILVCCSKRKITVLANRKGVLLWALDTAIPPYRVEFLEGEKLESILKP